MFDEYLPSEWFTEPLNEEQYQDILDVAGVKKVALSLITGRCGSTFLARAASKCNFGYGMENFNPRPLGEMESYSRNDFGTFLSELYASVNKSGTVYIQSTCWRFREIKKLLPFDFTTPNQTSLIFRRDVFSQAISYVFALDSNLWHSHDKGDVALRLPFEDRHRRAIQWVEEILAMEQDCISLAPNARTFYYEDIVASPVTTLMAFLEAHAEIVDANLLVEAISSGGLPIKLERPGYYDQLQHLLTGWQGAKSLQSRRLGRAAA